MNYRCPICHEELTPVAKSLQCEKGHCFDFAKSGYINLLTGRNSSKIHGDNQMMVKARTGFLEKDYYLPLVKGLIEILNERSPKVLVDCGCGEGYYTRQIKNALQTTEVFGFDLSKDAILYASKKDKASHYAISSIFDLPLNDCCADAIISLFAPVPLDEFDRILTSSGIAIVVTPEKNHLYGLKKQLYDEVYFNQVDLIDDARFKTLETIQIIESITLQSQEDIQNLFMMTPYYYKTSIEDKKKLESLTTLETEIAFSLQIIQKC